MSSFDSDPSSDELWEKSGDAESYGLLGSGTKSITERSWLKGRMHIFCLYVCNIVSLVGIAALSWKIEQMKSFDPSLQVYSPANDAVEWIPQHKFTAALFNNTPYMGYPTDETDQLWTDLYDFGISKISAQEAARLPNPTLTTTGTSESDDYVIELDVWHELHCLNDLRKVLYPERFGGIDELKDENGTINRETDMFRHWDHCIDSLRQTLMCHADVSPIPFHVNVPSNKGIFPRLATAHTCRNFTMIQEWAKTHMVGDWDFSLTRAQAQHIVETADFDQDPEEDIQFLYPEFPGFTWFKYWRDHPKEAEAERQTLGIDEYGRPT